MTELRKVRIQDPSDSSREAGLDNLAQNLVVVDFAHHEIHEGHAFTAFITVADLSAANIGLRWHTPNAGTQKMHAVLKASSTQDAHLDWWEGTGAGGSPFTPRNRRRDSATASAATAFNVGTITGGAGTLLESFDWGQSGTGINAGTPGGARGTLEWVLDVDTDYHVIMSGSGAAPAWIVLDWYEHTDS